MTDTQAAVIRAGVRASQVCAVAGVVLLIAGSWWWLLAVPVIVTMLWAWQVLYENVP